MTGAEYEKRQLRARDYVSGYFEGIEPGRIRQKFDDAMKLLRSS